MARYLTTIDTRCSPQDVFTYMADVRNFAGWDPGVRRAALVQGESPGLGTAYNVEVRAGPGTITLRYEIVEWDPPRRLVLRAKTGTLRSIDEIRVDPSDIGARVTYDADLTLRGVARLANPLLAFAFRRIGDRAARGLRSALEAEPLPEP
jgi:carbon monoxide dehydrogenase subunit G